MREMHGVPAPYALRMDIRLRQLQSLVAVVDQGTFTDAAIALGTSQASVSRNVAALEGVLGVRVLVRSPRQVTPTVAGARVVRHARRVLEEVEALGRSALADERQLRIGYSWAALGRHTTAVQNQWAATYPGAELVFVQSRTRTAGLSEGLAEVAVLRREVADVRIEEVLVGHERRVAALAATDPLARRRRLHLADFAGRIVAVDTLIGTTREELWAPEAAPAGMRAVQGIDEWLTLIASGRAIGLTAQASAVQYPRLGVVYRPVVDAAPVPVRLAWRRDDPPARLAELQHVVRRAYAAVAG